MSDNDGNAKEPQEMVWVLSITHDGLTFPEVHRTFESASDAAVADMREHEVEGRTRNYQRIREMIDEDVYYYDDCADTAYHFDECRLCE